jgi:hypothetical protein
MSEQIFLPTFFEIIGHGRRLHRHSPEVSGHRAVSGTSMSANSKLGISVMNGARSIAVSLLALLSGCGYIHHEYYTRKVQEEQRQAIDFLRSNEVVIREVGGIKDVIPSRSMAKHGESLPSRYVLSVYGVKSTQAVLNVSRASGDAQFTLACLGDFPPLQDAFKDQYECKK